ncbi:hypothetical protein LSCM1_06824 [Leishmania martiniquensis]|uniref:Uncharacterized protein n=1 Tax=Leishmania martiniquensis TaxID=1580590 RepID=A0A836KPF5_9TRYP|nr:hypothetical protein LSCM1_06824 [Leishmania martiniquensis]
MGFETGHFITDEDFEDPFDATLKLPSFMEFLDGVSSTEGSNTEQRHMSSTASRKSEAELVGSNIQLGLRLASSNTVADHLRQCYCLENAHCMCGDLFLPPLLVCNLSAALPRLDRSLTTSRPELGALTTPH